ncbi:MAG: PQQ-like beta-propeller repeat protein [Planctomycetes bacterium]|nr:PQQ-like beta-propeller repeat protein [Planctomycetota bacterium]MBL7037883.1 PQQ-like beta-propeller repeat protein [Pirellulaceae bacterium]
MQNQTDCSLKHPARNSSAEEKPGFSEKAGFLPDAKCSKTRDRVLIQIRTLLSACAVVVLLASPVAAAESGSGTGTVVKHNWPRWRGPLDTGVAPDADPPVEWSESKNIRWKIALPGLGHSTPIVWDDRIFITAAVPYGDALKPRYSNAPGAHDNRPITHRQEFVVLAVSRRHGKILWQRTVRKELPHEGAHYTGSLASNSPVTDGEHLFALFGSYGLYCLNLDGEFEWEKDLGKMQVKHGHGEGTSPTLYSETLIINWDHEGQSFVAALDKRTGKERWKVAREEVTSWATPIAVEVGGKPQLIVSGTDRVRGYDLATGNIIWECGGLSANIVASPVAAEGMVYAASSYDKQAMLAIRLDGAKGDITGTEQVAWSRIRRTPYVPSPLLYGDSLYFLRHYQGILSRVDAKTGEERLDPFRLGGIRNVYSSPVGAANRVYIIDRDGATMVISHEPTPRILALNRLNDTFSASAAIVGREMVLRGQRYLYCIAGE